jgi:hypothetical protein
MEKVLSKKTLRNYRWLASRPDVAAKENERKRASRNKRVGDPEQRAAYLARYAKYQRDYWQRKRERENRLEC